MYSANTKFEKKDHISYKIVDNVLYILDPHKGHLYTLNSTAKYIFMELMSKKTVADTMQSLKQRYQLKITERNLKADIISIVTLLQKQNIIKKSNI